MADILIAPDSFKGTLSAFDAARAIADGWERERPADRLRLMPMADGGEGTQDAFEAAVPGAERHPIEVTGPDDRRVRASWLRLPGDAGETGVVELASTSGLTLLGELRPLQAHTIGFGEAIAAALDAGVHRLILAIGGSSSTDAAAGALSVLGARFARADGSAVPAGNRGLGEVERADYSRLRPVPAGGVVILSDVTSPLLGRTGAAHVFGAQKGADEEQRAAMDENLRRFAAHSPVDPMTAGAGAAGGSGFGLLTWGAVAAGSGGGVSLVAGARAVGDAIGLPVAFSGADVVITGEGRFDAQSAVGKVPSYISGLARTGSAPDRGGCPLLFLVAGSVAAAADGFAEAVDLSVLAGGVERALADPAVQLERAGRELAGSATRHGVPVR